MTNLETFMHDLLDSFVVKIPSFLCLDDIVQLHKEIFTELGKKILYSLMKCPFYGCFSYSNIFSAQK